jgi:hypothetical protein
MRFFLLLQEHLANLVVLIHQNAQIITNLDKNIVRVSLANLLHSLYFFVILNLLCVRWIRYLLELRLQIIQYIFYFPRCTLDVLVELASFLYRRDSSVGSSE